MGPFFIAIYGVLGLFGIPGACSQVAGGCSRGKTQYKVLLGGQKRTFYARAVEMAIGPGLWWPVFYHTKCFLALRNGPAVREGCK